MYRDQLRKSTYLYNPIDVVEDMIIMNNWDYERGNENNLHVEVGGEWCDYQLSFGHEKELRILQVSCAYDIRIPEQRIISVYPLLAKLNERMLIGHFELWNKVGWPIYRHAIPLPNDKLICIKQIEEICMSSIKECDRYYPTFQ